MGHSRGHVDETMARFGLHAEVVLDQEAAAARYITRADGSMVGRPYGFGVLVHARTDPAAL